VPCKIVWSPEAAEDLEAISEFIARDSSFYARAVVAEILKTTRSIPDYPYLGRIVPEYSVVKIRERFVYNYRIVYRVAENEILIVAIIHGARKLD
jgi:plasmid stabilization system protein ParE